MGEIIDLKDVLERVQDDKELLLELFDIFQEDFSAKRNALWAAFQKNDAVTFQQLAHGFKGATGNISAHRMHETCVELDRMGKAKDITAAKPMLELFDGQYVEFQAEVVRLKAEFGK